MKTMILAALSLVLGLALLTFSYTALTQPPVHSMSVECNWGTLTMTAIAGGFPQGPDSADPAGDGQGGGDDQPRVGLGNVIEQGNLQATCEFIGGLI